MLESARVSGAWIAAPTPMLLSQVEAGAVEAAAAELRRLPAPAGLTRAERRVWRQAAKAAEAAMRRAAALLVDPPAPAVARMD